MSQTQHFQAGSQTITLQETPWKVTRAISIYVKRVGKQLSLYNNSKCHGKPLSPASLEVYRGQSTGLYFYIAAGSTQGTQFPDPAHGQMPIAWDPRGSNNDTSCPPTVLYGKVKADFSAFSMSDTYNHTSKTNYSFDIVVDPGDGGPFLRTSLFDKIDPTIVEKGTDPPSGL